MKKILLILSILMISLTGCSGKDIDDFFKPKEDVVGYTNGGAVDKSKMTDLAFEQLHYGATVIRYEDRFLFTQHEVYEFPGLITSKEDWNLLQEKLNIDMEEIDFDEYVVFAAFQYDLWGSLPCRPVMIKEMAYNDQTLYYGWKTSEGYCFASEDEEDRVCGFDLVKIRRSDFPMESRDVFGAAMYEEEYEGGPTIFMESGGSYLMY